MLIINDWYLKVKNVSTISNIRVTFQKNSPDWLSKDCYIMSLDESVCSVHFAGKRVFEHQQGDCRMPQLHFKY